MTYTALCHALESGACDTDLGQRYPSRCIASVRQRCLHAAAEFVRRFGEAEDLMLLCAPGRTEIGGNHTDHNGGRVLAAAVDLDILAVAAPAADGIAWLQSEGLPENRVSLRDLAPCPTEQSHSDALIRGIAAALHARGWTVGGWHAYTVSQVPTGSGLSSSAAFEVLVCRLFSELYNGGRLPAQEAAQISQYAENVYFGKPCGLMDPMASAVGGVIAMDFCDAAHPAIQSVPFDAAVGYALCVVDTQGHHRDLTADYAAIPAEMKAVAAVLGTDLLGHADESAFWRQAAAIRKCCGDRAFLRAAHFYRENDRVLRQIDALRNGAWNRFLRLVSESGRSSWMLLQNLYSPSAPAAQGLSVGLCATEHFLQGQGACRVHGGGFAGTIQVYLPLERVTAYRCAMDALFGADCCHVLSVRPPCSARIL